MRSEQPSLNEAHPLAATDSPQVFWASGSPYSWRVLLALELKRIPYESHLLQLSQNEHHKPEYLALNNRAKLPTLRDGSFIVSESLAIMAYLDRKYPEPAIFGKSAREAGRIWQLISEFSSYLDGPLGRVVRPFYFGTASQHSDDIHAAIMEVHTELNRLEKTVAGRSWLAGGASASAADAAIYPFITSLLRAAGKPQAESFGLNLVPFDSFYPLLTGWMHRVEQLPGYGRTYPPHWRT